MTKEKLEWLKSSNEIESYRERKQDIIDDLKLCISYTPNRENDLLAIMEQYIKAEVVERNKILAQLKCCINDEEYENPYALYYSYGDEDIEELDSILNDYIDNLKRCFGDIRRLEVVVENTITKINRLHKKCFEELIDHWRSQRLIDLLITTANLAGFKIVESLIHASKLW